MVQDKEMRAKYIQKYGLKFFRQLDEGITNKGIVEYYKAKYNDPVHLVMLIQHLSQEKRPVEIDEEVHSIPGIKISKVYYSCSVSRKLEIACNVQWPKPNRQKREGKQNRTKKGHGEKVNTHPVTMHNGICFECGKPFTLNRHNHPANLCFCLKCAPTGALYGEVFPAADTRNLTAS